MQRRKFLQQSALASAGMFAGGSVLAGVSGAGPAADFPVVRIPAAKRKFTSPIVERTIHEVRTTIGNKEMGWLFENCFPNTLDTTVDFSMAGGRPDTYVITGISTRCGCGTAARRYGPISGYVKKTRICSD